MTSRSTCRWCGCVWTAEHRCAKNPASRHSTSTAWTIDRKARLERLCAVFKEDNVLQALRECDSTASHWDDYEIMLQRIADLEQEVITLHGAILDGESLKTAERLVEDVLKIPPADWEREALGVLKKVLGG